MYHFRMPHDLSIWKPDFLNMNFQSGFGMPSILGFGILTEICYYLVSWVFEPCSNPRWKFLIRKHRRLASLTEKKEKNCSYFLFITCMATVIPIFQTLFLPPPFYQISENYSNGYRNSKITLKLGNIWDQIPGQIRGNGSTQVIFKKLANVVHLALQSQFSMYHAIHIASLLLVNAQYLGNFQPGLCYQ